VPLPAVSFADAHLAACGDADVAREARAIRAALDASFAVRPACRQVQGLNRHSSRAAAGLRPYLQVCLRCARSCLCHAIARTFMPLIVVDV